MKNRQSIILERAGLLTPTIVHYKDSIIATVGNSLDENCKIWRKTFNLRGKIRLLVPSSELYEILHLPHMITVLKKNKMDLEPSNDYVYATLKYKWYWEQNN